MNAGRDPGHFMKTITERRWRRTLLPQAGTVVLALVLAAAVVADESPDRVGLDPEPYQTTVAKGIDFFVSQGQSADGSFSAFAGTEPTSLATTALLPNGRTAQDPAVAKGLAYLENVPTLTGGIYALLGFFKNYETCAALMCFQEANRGEQDKELLERAEALIRGIQLDEGGRQGQVRHRVWRRGLRQ